MATFVATILLVMLVCASTQNSFRFPWMGGSGFDDLHGSGLRWQPSSFHDDGYDGYFGQRVQKPCPRYQPIRLSDWKQGADGQVMLKVFLPDVQQHDMHAWLSQGGSAIHIQGLRGLASRGRTCLPEEAKMSANGQYEILEASVLVPALGDAQRASVRQQQGGLVISMPHRPRSQASGMEVDQMFVSEAVRSAQAAQTAAQATRAAAQEARTAAQEARARAAKAARAAQERAAEAARVAMARQAQADRWQKKHAKIGPLKLPAVNAHEVTRSLSGMSPLMQSLLDANPTSTDELGSRQSGVLPTQIPDEGHHKLPPKDAHEVTRIPSVTLPPMDVLVEDADFPWPEKSTEAVEGWMDNRGDFQYY